MTDNQFFEKKGPFPLGEIAKTIGYKVEFSKGRNGWVIKKYVKLVE